MNRNGKEDQDFNEFEQYGVDAFADSQNALDTQDLRERAREEPTITCSDSAEDGGEESSPIGKEIGDDFFSEKDLVDEPPQLLEEENQGDESTTEDRPSQSKSHSKPNFGHFYEGQFDQSSGISWIRHITKNTSVLIGALLNQLPDQEAEDLSNVVDRLEGVGEHFDTLEERQRDLSKRYSEVPGAKDFIDKEDAFPTRQASSKKENPQEKLVSLTEEIADATGTSNGTVLIDRNQPFSIQLKQIEKALDKIDERLDEFESRLDKMEGKLETYQAKQSEVAEKALGVLELKGKENALGYSHQVSENSIHWNQQAKQLTFSKGNNDVVFSAVRQEDGSWKVNEDKLSSSAKDNFVKWVQKAEEKAKGKKHSSQKSPPKQKAQIEP